jgi:hypothetical protein
MFQNNEEIDLDDIVADEAKYVKHEGTRLLDLAKCVVGDHVASGAAIGTFDGKYLFEILRQVGTLLPRARGCCNFAPHPVGEELALTLSGGVAAWDVGEEGCHAEQEANRSLCAIRRLIIEHICDSIGLEFGRRISDMIETAKGCLYNATIGFGVADDGYTYSHGHAIMGDLWVPFDPSEVRRIVPTSAPEAFLFPVMFDVGLFGYTWLPDPQDPRNRPRTLTGLEAPRRLYGYQGDWMAAVECTNRKVVISASRQLEIVKKPAQDDRDK